MREMGRGITVSVLVLAILMTTGCGFATRHPVQTKVYIIAAGILAGGAIAQHMKAQPCASSYTDAQGHSYPYNGTHDGTHPCPVNGSYDPGGHR